MPDRGKTVFVLGAGASAHAGYPLAAHLGTALLKWSSDLDSGDECRQAIRTLAEHGDLNELEPLLTKLDRGELPISQGTQNFLRRAISRLFLELRETEAVGYRHFAERCVEPRDTVLTFNYDLALERELKWAGLWEIDDGYGFRIFESETTSSVRLLKLHGSTNWFTALFGGSRGAGMVSESEGAMGSRPVIATDELEFLGYKGKRDPRFPGTWNLHNMILPTFEKKFYEDSNLGREREHFWDSLWHQAENALRGAECIYISGYSLPKEDERARSLLCESPTKGTQLSIICGRSSEPIAEQFRHTGFSDVRAYANLRFEQWTARTNL